MTKDMVQIGPSSEASAASRVSFQPALDRFLRHQTGSFPRALGRRSFARRVSVHAVLISEAFDHRRLYVVARCNYVRRVLTDARAMGFNPWGG